MVCAVAFCGPFCKICFQDVLELSDSALGKLASSRQVLVENFLSTAQCVPRDCDDLTDATTSAEEHRDGGPTNVVEVNLLRNASGLTGRFPLLSEVALSERAACLSRQDYSGSTRSGVQRG